MDCKQIILNKCSVRDYKAKKVDAKAIKELSQYVNHCPKLVEDIAMDIRIMDNDVVYRQLDGFAGYHGILINAPHYIIILSEHREHYIENAGFVGESISMKAYEMGVDSCWITFNDSEKVIHRLNIVTNKEVVGILAIGYGKKKTPITLGTLKVGDNYSQADMRKKDSSQSKILPLQEMVYIDRWGEGADVNMLLERALYEPMDCVRKAPSTMNRQPWRFLIVGGKIILAMRKDSDISEYEKRIDAGIAMMYFEAVMEQTVCQVQWTADSSENVYAIPEDYEIVASCEV